MKIHIISEGPTDRELIISILKKLIPQHLQYIIRESNSQLKYRGINPILFDYSKFSKFLHYAFSKLLDIIIICVDNDNAQINSKGISTERKGILDGNIKKFINSNSHIYPNINPCYVLIVPIETMDYWIKCVKSRETDCNKLRRIERISKSQIKSLTYGSQNIYYGWMIDREAINQAKQEIETETLSITKLRCLPSFVDFEEQINNCISNINNEVNFK